MNSEKNIMERASLRLYVRVHVARKPTCSLRLGTFLCQDEWPLLTLLLTRWVEIIQLTGRKREICIK